MSREKKSDIFDFKQHSTLETSFAADYLRQYYQSTRPVTDDEAAVYRFIRRISPLLSGDEDCLEIGCGPTLHHAIMLAPFVGSLTLADYLEENLRFVAAWRDNVPDAWDWSNYTSLCLKEDGLAVSNENLNARENLTRTRVIGLRHINLLLSYPLEGAKTAYDMVASFYCTEEIALTKARWQEVMRSVVSLIKPEGYLLLSCLEDTDFYHICGDDGVVRELPCAKIGAEDLTETLQELGFQEEQTIIDVVRTPNQQAEGVAGVLLAFAKKNA